jgi:hypothetical protein
MKGPQAFSRCGLSGKIVCQCNNNTFSPGKLKAAAMLPSKGVLIAVPVSGTFRMLQGGDSIRREEAGTSRH